MIGPRSIIALRLGAMVVALVLLTFVAPASFGPAGPNGLDCCP